MQPTVTRCWLAELNATVKAGVSSVAPVPSMTLGTSMATVASAEANPLPRLHGGRVTRPVSDLAIASAHVLIRFCNCS